MKQKVPVDETRKIGPSSAILGSLGFSPAAAIPSSMQRNYMVRLALWILHSGHIVEIDGVK